MKLEHVLQAIDGLAKEAQETDPTKIAPGKAFKDLTPEQQAQRRQAYQNKRRQNGINMQRGNVKKVYDFQPGAFISGFGENLREKGLSNLASGAKSMALGVAKGVADLPSDLVGIGAGTLSFAKNKFWDGKGWKDSWNQAVQTGGNAMDTFDRYTGLEWTKDKINAARQNNMTEYMKNNGMDPNNMSGLDSAGLAGLSIANGAGQAIGISKGTGVWRKALKAPGTVVKTVRHPIKTMQSATRSLKSTRVANQAFKKTMADPAARKAYIDKMTKLKSQGTKVPNKQHFEMAKRQDMGFSNYHAQGLRWKLPVATGWAGSGAVEPYTQNKEYYEFGNRLSKGPAGNPQNSAGGSSAGTAVSTYSSPEDNLASYLNL